MLGIDPLELRRKNIRKPHDLGPLEHRIASTDGAAQVLNAISKSLISDIIFKTFEFVSKKPIGFI